MSDEQAPAGATPNGGASAGSTPTGSAPAGAEQYEHQEYDPGTVPEIPFVPFNFGGLANIIIEHGQRTQLAEGVTMREAPAPDRSNIDGMSHEELVARTESANGGQVGGLGESWVTLGNRIMDFGRNLDSTANSSEAVWVGSAGAQARSMLTGLAAWSGSTGQGVQYMGTTVREQSDAASTVRNSMPEPVPYDAGDYRSRMLETTNVVEMFQIADEARTQHAAHIEAQDEARRVASSYSDSLIGTASTMPAFAPPPTMTGGGGDPRTVDPFSTTGSGPNTSNTGPSGGPGAIPTGNTPAPGGGTGGGRTPPPQLPPASTGSQGSSSTGSLTPSPVRPPVIGGSGGRPPGGGGGIGSPTVPSPFPIGPGGPSGPGGPGAPPFGGRGPGAGGPGTGGAGMGGRGFGPGGSGGGFGPGGSGAGGSGAGGAGAGRGGMGFGPAGALADDAARGSGSGSGSATGAAGAGGRGGAGGGMGGAPMGGAGGRGRGEEDGEHKRPGFLVETEDIWGDGRRVAPPVIGDDPPEHYRR